MRSVVADIALGVLLAASASAAEDAVVSVEAGLLHVSARGAPVSSVLAAIGEKTSVKFVVDPQIASGTADVEVAGADLERALGEVIRQIPGAAGRTFHYATSETGERRVDEVRIFGRGVPRSAPAEVIERSEAIETLPQGLSTTRDFPENPRDEDDVDEARAAEEDPLATAESLTNVGVPRETAKRFIAAQARKQQVRDANPGASVPEDVAAESQRAFQELSAHVAPGFVPE